MCFHEFYLSTACGHHFPKLPPSAKPNEFFNNYHSTIAVPQSLTCPAVKLALKFYHDQVVYLPADMNCGAKVDIPKSCPIVHRPRDGQTKRATREHHKAAALLNNTMLRNGLGPWQQWQIEIDAARLDQCSNRAKPGEHSPAALRRHRELQYPLNMYAHVQNLKAFQTRDRRSMAPNVWYTNVDFGCGGPFSPECLTGWDGAGLLTHRLHLWSDAITHPKPCNNECLTGWSGADLNTYRQQTWGDDNLKKWGHVDYPKSAREYVFNHTEHWAAIDYSNVSHLHADQFDWDGSQFVRKHELPNGQVVHIPEFVSVPVPNSLDQVLREMHREPFSGSPPPEEVDYASIEDLLGRLPEAFEAEQPLSREGSEPRVDIAEGSESGSTLVEEPVAEPEPVPVETPEMAEARRQRAREVMREKLKRDFSKGKGKMTDEADKVPAEAETARSMSNEPAEGRNEGEHEAKSTALRNSSSVETILAATPPNSATTAHTASPSTLPTTLPQIQTPAPLTAPSHQLTDLQIKANHRLSHPFDESNSSPINDVHNDLYDTEEGEEELSKI